MTELSTIAAADRFRVFQDGLRRRDQQQAEVQRTQNQSFDDRLRQQELVTADARLAERRIQDRRDILDAERAVQNQLRDQQRAQDQIASDEAFVRRQDSINSELNAVRDNRDLNESLQLRARDDERIRAAELSAVEQRNVDLRQQLIDRDARIIERRQQERDATIQQEAALRRGLERIQSDARNSHSGAERPRGALLDVSG